MSYKMIVSDLDGTMFESDLKLNEKNAESVKKAMEAGFVFAIATGRPGYSTLPIARGMGMDKNQYAICFNGAMITETTDEPSGNIIYSLPLEEEEALYLVKNAKDRGVAVIAYIDGEAYTHYMDEQILTYSSHVGVKVKADKMFEDVYRGGFDKVILYGDPDALKIIEGDLSEWAKERVSCEYSSYNLIEYCNKAATKGSAVLHLAEKLGIRQEEIIAMGDYYNDITMLKAAGLGVAIKNSPADVISAAGYVTERTAGEGAVSEVIEKFMFGRG